MVAQMMLDPFRRPGDVDHSPIMLPVTGGMITATILGAASGANFSEPVNTVAGFLCIGAIVGLSTMRTANVGCKLGMAGVGGAVSTTLMNVSPGYTILVLSMLGLGGAAGYNVQSLVYPIQLPQTDDSVSLAGGGGSAMFASIGPYMSHPEVRYALHNTAALLGDFSGGATLTGTGPGNYCPVCNFRLLP